MTSAAALFRRLTNAQDVVAATYFAAALLLAEACLCAGIIWKVQYTEIDWVAYMQQVEGFLQGERDYRALKGQTGPLVYPAGFLYTYSAFYWASGGGQVVQAQALFAIVYLLTQATVMWLYVRSRAVPPLALVLLCASKRLHSIFLLRLFNDGPAMLIAYLATALLVLRRWRGAVVAFSAAVSLKMNVLLMAPSVLIVGMKGSTPEELLEGAALGAGLQLLLGAPFLWHDAGAYLGRAFELSRVFLHVWSVNLKFLPEPIFQARWLAAGLLAGHLTTLWLFARHQWCKPEGGLLNVMTAFWQRSRARGKLSPKPPGRRMGRDPRHEQSPDRRGGAPTKGQAGRRDSHALPPGTCLRTEHVLMILFSGNFIGIVFSRTLHYQFYAWYSHMLPFLLWQAEMHWIVRAGLWFAIELVWNVYPSTATSSLSLLACHLCVLLALWLGCKPIKPYEKLP